MNDCTFYDQFSVALAFFRERCINYATLMQRYATLLCK